MAGSPSKEPGRIRQLFGTIAENYDLLNRLLSAGIDLHWRRVMVQRLQGPRLLDVACGTGDVLMSADRTEFDGWMVGLDFSRPMLSRAESKLRRSGTPPGNYGFLQGDALVLPFGPGQFNTVTVAFGVRNFTDRGRGFRETFRVLEPGGRFLILEFFPPPERWYLWPFRVYLRHVLPRIGRWVSGSSAAYGYLRDSIEGFCSRDELRDELETAGFINVAFREFHGGVVTLVQADKP